MSLTAEEYKELVYNNPFPKEHMFAHLIRNRGFRKVAEIGVASGNLVNRVLTDSSIDLDLYLAVDPWVVYIESYNRPPHAKEKQQSWWDSLFQRVKAMEERFTPLWVWRQPSAEGSGNAIGMNLSLDCVYIDAIHDAENIIIDVFGWLHVIRDGGVICGHDYSKAYTDMALALDSVFKDEVNLMLLKPNKHKLSYRNTYQSHWWVDIKEYKKPIYLDRMQELYPDILKEVREGWRSV
jgi:hypothetical protein